MQFRRAIFYLCAPRACPLAWRVLNWVIWAVGEMQEMWRNGSASDSRPEGCGFDSRHFHPTARRGARIFALARGDLAIDGTRLIIVTSKSARGPVNYVAVDTKMVDEVVWSSGYDDSFTPSRSRVRPPV